MSAVANVLKLLAQRLDSIIQSRLSDVLKTLDWTVILKELDTAKGIVGKVYTRNDLQSQLRMLTEKLGGLGFPFDDRNRTASNRASELRLIRNRWAHNDTFTAWDNLRAADSAYLLLDYFDDEKGKTAAYKIRQEALTRLIAEEGLTEETISSDLRPPQGELDDPKIVRAKSSNVVQPEDEVFFRSNSGNERVLIGAKRAEFEGWKIIIVGDRSVVENLPRKREKEFVRSLAEEIVEFEGPIEVSRLARIIANSFGVRRLSDARKKQIVHQVKASGIFIDSDKFAWPEKLSRSDWREFRPGSAEGDRDFTEVSPVEIRNAVAFIIDKHPGLSAEELKRKLLQTFGRKRMTTGYAKHLEKALNQIL